MRDAIGGLFAICMFLMLAYAIAGFLTLGDEERQIKEEEARQEALLSADTVVNNLSKNTLRRTCQVENFDFITTYSTGTYDLDKWKFTDSKAIDVSAEVKNVSKGTTILINNIYINMTLKSTEDKIDETVIQYCKNDSYVGKQQDGFLINETYNYQKTFLINALNEDFIDNYTSRYGTLSEEYIVDKFYANKIQIRYDLLIKNEGEELYHSVSVSEEFTIPVYKEKTE